ncbi:MAG: hypothetical protein SVU32_02475, partial [Candidatus Nanohaloarchaea archaeon]|nr:hypothetical protein [Candidatus Nanohaloarchaea archaeon]
RGFDRVKITATNMTIRANSLWVTGNPKFDYDRSDTIDFDEEIVSGEQSLLCIVNDGNLDISDCQGGAAFGHCSSGSCRAIADGYPLKKAGYYCQSGVYTRRNYYVKRALSDGPRCGSSHSGEFLIGNYFSCPDQAEPNADVSCSVRITYNCTTSTASPPHSVMRLEWGSTTRTSEKTFNCAGETVSRKHRIIKEMPEGQDTITASVEITSSMGDYTPPEVTISAVSE